MDYETKTRLARWADSTESAISARLVAARLAAGYTVQKDFAQALGISKTTYNSQEIQGHPSMDTIRFLYQNHRIDFNFILYGDFSQLPGDVQAALFSALSGSARSGAPAAS